MFIFWGSQIDIKHREMDEKERLKLIDDVQKMSDEDFIRWYAKTIKYSTILTEIVNGGINNEYYKIFCQVLDDNVDAGVINNAKIMKLFAPEADYFYFYVECCKTELIEKLSSK